MRTYVKPAMYHHVPSCTMVSWCLRVCVLIRWVQCVFFFEMGSLHTLVSSLSLSIKGWCQASHVYVAILIGDRKKPFLKRMTIKKEGNKINLANGKFGKDGNNNYLANHNSTVFLRLGTSSGCLRWQWGVAGAYAELWTIVPRGTSCRFSSV